MIWLAACRDVNPYAEELPIMEDFTTQSSEDHD
jgi:hypothetical protein